MFSKSIVALITPFDASGAVDYDAFERLVSMHLEMGTRGLLILGSTGEGLSLSLEEKEKLICLAIQTVKGKMPIMVGASCASIKACLEMFSLIKKGGAQAALVTPPFYVCPSQKGVIAYFKELNKFGLPIVLYHHPGRTGVRLTLETAKEIADLNNVIGIKESSGDEAFFKALKETTETPLFVGDDEALLALSAYGAKGSISVLANAFADKWSSYVELCLSGKIKEAEEEQSKFKPLFKALFLETNPVGIKCLMGLLELSEPYVRLPLLQADKASKKAIDEALAPLLHKLF